MTDQERDLLMRMDERLRALYTSIEDIKARIFEYEKKYVSRAEFRPVQLLAYGLVSMILVAVFGALISLVVLQ